LDGLITNVNTKIIKCLRRVIKYARENGVRVILQYGDVGDKTYLSYEAQVALYEFLLQEKLKDLEFHFVLGNHDFAENGVHSLQVLESVSRLTTNNIKVYTTMEMVKIEKRLFNMMPHPFTDFKREALNVAHLELANSFRDNGRKIDHGLKTKHAGVMGHLHTMHRVRRVHYSGTLYQTNFGESLPKSFHHVRYEDDDPYNVEVTNVPFEPPWKLLNLEVNTEDDLSSIVEDPDTLYKLFIKEGLDLDMMDVMNTYPNVVRHNKFSSKTELKELIENEWDFESGSVVNNVDTREVLSEYLTTKSKLSKKEVKRAFLKLSSLTNKAKEPA
jgi:DNA repair exonuclease SbcCD nuclease subunit